MIKTNKEILKEALADNENICIDDETISLRLDGYTNNTYYWCDLYFEDLDDNIDLDEITNEYSELFGCVLSTMERDITYTALEKLKDLEYDVYLGNLKEAVDDAYEEYEYVESGFYSFLYSLETELEELLRKEYSYMFEDKENDTDYFLNINKIKHKKYDEEFEDYINRYFGDYDGLMLVLELNEDEYLDN